MQKKLSHVSLGTWFSGRNKIANRYSNFSVGKHLKSFQLYVAKVWFPLYQETSTVLMLIVPKIFSFEFTFGSDSNNSVYQRLKFIDFPMSIYWYNLVKTKFFFLKNCFRNYYDIKRLGPSLKYFSLNDFEKLKTICRWTKSKCYCVL